MINKNLEEICPNHESDVHSKQCPIGLAQTHAEIFENAVEVKLLDERKLVRATDGYWYGVAQTQTKMRYKFIGDAYQAVLKIKLPPEKLRSSEHSCHLPDCEEVIAPKFLMCAKHWKLVPKELQQEVYRFYRTGQEKTKNPSKNYLQAARRAILAVEEKLSLRGTIRQAKTIDEDIEPSLFD